MFNASSFTLCLLLCLTSDGASQQGSLISWGSDSHSVVSSTPSGTDFLQVAAGKNFSAAIKADGSLVAWGDDSYGVVSGVPLGNNFAQIVAGDRSAMCLRTDGSLISWGTDVNGQVDDTPTANDFIGIGTGPSHSIALKADGSLVSWGADLWGAVSNTPTGTDFVQVECSEYYSIALKADGSLISWGRDEFQKVSGTPTGTGFQQVSSGSSGSVALKADGSIVCWGSDLNGQVSNTPVGNDFTQVEAGSWTTFALKSDQSIVGWGSDSNGLVSNAPIGMSFQKVAGGSGHAIAISDSPGLPVLAVTNLIELATAEIQASNCSPGDALTVGASLVGPGPIYTSFGVVHLSRPIIQFPIANADSAGIAAWQAPMPRGSGGLSIWFHSANLSNGFLSNSFMAIVDPTPRPVPRWILPEQGQQDSLVAIMIGGVRFTPGCEIELFNSSSTFAVTEEWFAHESLIGGKLDLTGVPIGLYSIRVISARGPIGELSGSFEVTPNLP